MRFDPETRAVKTYHREQGLQGEEFDFERVPIACATAACASAARADSTSSIRRA